jgi:hypothetical protein
MLFHFLVLPVLMIDLDVVFVMGMFDFLDIAFALVMVIDIVDLVVGLWCVLGLNRLD